MTNHPHFIQLIGNSEENFYQLGLKDADSYHLTLDKLKKITYTDYLHKALGLTVDQVYKVKSNPFQFSKKFLDSYADGLDISRPELQFSYLLPEFMSSFGKWTPILRSYIPGCSSYFHMDKDTGEIYHGRNLDFPLVGPYIENEQVVSYQMEGFHKIISCTTAGLALPSLTCMNDHGLSLSIHQKFSNKLDIEGRSILDIAFELIATCTNINEVQKKLRNMNSMTRWGLYMASKEGKVLAVDLEGEHFHSEVFQLEDNPDLYFNNLPIRQTKEDILIPPFGFKAYCEMRTKSAENFLAKTKKKGEDRVINLLTDLNNQKGEKSRNWCSPVNALSTLQSSCFNLTNSSLLYVNGDFPKNVHVQSPSKIENIWDRPKWSEVKLRSTAHKKTNIYKYMGESQSHFDNNESEMGFHKIQMAIKFSKGLPEEPICQFFYLVWSYLKTTKKEELGHLLSEFRLLEKRLPPYLDDQWRLFILRLHRELGITYEHLNKPHHPALSTIYEREMELPKHLFRLTKKMLFPRMEIIDIISID
jgi:hypothetical protein